MTTNYHAWTSRLTALLSATEASYDLQSGEVLQATGTTEADLQELFGFGWTAEESARAITETLGLR